MTSPGPGARGMLGPMSPSTPPLPPPGGFGAGAPRGATPYGHAPPPPSGSASGIIVALAVVGGLVVILGILSVLAIYGVRKYIASVKTMEARNTTALLAKTAIAAHERDGKLCPSTRAVPKDPSEISGKKYMSRSGEWSEAGFDCLRFEMTSPQYYSYEYISNGDSFEVVARGDLNGDGVLSTFRTRGRVQPGGVQLSTEENFPLE